MPFGVFVAPMGVTGGPTGGPYCTLTAYQTPLSWPFVASTHKES